MTTAAERIALWADKLRDMSAIGLHYADNMYDRERYRAIQDVAMAMFALAADEALEALEPLRNPVFSRPTPLCAGDAAIIDDAGRILLVRRADNQKWAMPGGALEVGETPAEGVIREAVEETGVRCEAVALIGVFDSRLCGSRSRYHVYHFTFLCRPLDGQVIGRPTHAHEVLDVGWFRGGRLPDDMDPGHVSRIPEAFRVWRNDRRAFFDR